MTRQSMMMCLTPSMTWIQNLMSWIQHVVMNLMMSQNMMSMQHMISQIKKMGMPASDHGTRKMVY